MRKLAVLSIIFLLIFISYASASIQINGIDESYIVGDEISPLLTITPEIDSDSLLSASIICPEYELNYLIIPINFEKDKEIDYDVPQLILTDQMIGTCYILFDITSIFGSDIEEEESEKFEIKPLETSEENKTEEITEEETPLLDNEIENTEEIESGQNQVVLAEESIADAESDTEESQNASTATKLKFVLYTLLAILIILTILYLYLKFRFRNKNKFNRGWKLPPSKL